MEPICFSKWLEMEQFIIEKTGCKPFSGAGINPRISKKTTILRSVDGTSYYDDDMSDIDNTKYTLYGHNGNQNEHEKHFNEPLLNANKTEHIYLYRVMKLRKKTTYMWYGKYVIVDKITKLHPGKDNIIRKIIVLSLKRVTVV